MKKTANIWEYKVAINGIIANFVHLWICLLTLVSWQESNAVRLLNNIRLLNQKVQISNLYSRWYHFKCENTIIKTVRKWENLDIEALWHKV